MSTIERVETQVATREPALLVHAALWVLALVGEWLIGRTHLITAAEWSAATSYLTPIITTAVLALSAWITRTLVSPAGAFAERVEAEVRLRLERAEKAAQGYLSGTAVSRPHPSPGPVVADPDPVADPEPEPVADPEPAADPEPVPDSTAVETPDTVPDPT